VLTLFHISDFHFKADHPSVERLKILVRDIEKMLPRNDAYLVFSGDLAFSGEKNQYESLLEHFFIPLENRFKKLYLVPGNHDIDRKNSDINQSNKFLDDKAQSYLYGGHSSVTLENPFHGIDPLAEYFSLEALLSSSLDSNYFFWRDLNEDFDIVGFNSTWLSCERSDGETDLGRLRVDPAILDEAISTDQNKKLQVAVMHHPLEWIDEDLRRDVQDRLIANFDIILTGHTHNPSKLAGNFDAGDCVFLQAPAVRSEYYFGSNAYSMINIDPEEKAFEFVYRTYSETRRAFVYGEELCPGGVSYPNDDHKKFWTNRKAHTSEGLLDSFRIKRRDFDAIDWYSRNFVSKTKDNGRYFEPKLSRIRFKDGNQISERPISVSEALSVSSKRQIVLGPKDSGLSTAAFVYVKKTLETERDLLVVPTYINLKGLTVNRASLLKEATKGSVVSFTHRQIEMLADSGSLLFIFDQIEISDSEKVNSVCDVLEKYFPECSSLFFASTDGTLFHIDGGESSRLNPVEENIFQLNEMTSSDIRELITVLRPLKTEIENSALLNNVIASFKQMDEPIYPSAVCILLETLDQIPDFRPLNRVKLLDRYVECLLGRFEIEDVQEGVFNSTEKIKLLAFISGRMARDDRTCLSETDWHDLVAEYAETKMLEVPNKLLDEFVDKAILLIGGEGITFRADYLYTYFVAKEMNVNSELFVYVTSDDVFFRFFRELVFFGELEGVDSTNLLDSTNRRLCELEEKIIEQYYLHKVDLDLEYENMLIEGRDSSSLDELSAAVEEVLDSVPDQKSEDESRDLDLQRVERGRGVHSRHTIRFLEARWLAAMRTYFQLIRHNTGSNAAEKKRHISKSLESCALFLKTLAAKRGIIAIRPAAFVSGIIYCCICFWHYLL